MDSDDEEDFEMSDVPDEADDLRPDMTADEEMARRLQERNVFRRSSRSRERASAYGADDRDVGRRASWV